MILSQLESHEKSDVREATKFTRTQLKKMSELITDIDIVRKTAPFQMGDRIRFSGGYSHSELQPWLGGTDFIEGIFTDFFESTVGALPIAIVLDVDVDFTETTGLWHSGNIAIARVLYSGEPWEEGSVVMIHVLDQIPEDISSDSLKEKMYLAES